MMGGAGSVPMKSMLLTTCMIICFSRIAAANSIGEAACNGDIEYLAEQGVYGPRPMTVIHPPNAMLPQAGPVKQTDFTSPLARRLQAQNQKQFPDRPIPTAPPTTVTPPAPAPAAAPSNLLSPQEIERRKAIAVEKCKEWQNQLQRQAAVKEAAEQAAREYVPQYVETQQEWHLINQDVHGNMTIIAMEHHNVRVDPESGATLGYDLRQVPRDTRVSLAKGTIFAIKRGTFNPAAIETTGGVFGMTTVGGISNGQVTFPTAAADPTPWECQVDTTKEAYRVLGKYLIRCRRSPDEEWMSNDERDSHEAKPP